MQARFGEGFFSIVTRKNYLLHPTSSGFESRATHMENWKEESEFLILTHFIYKNFRQSDFLEACLLRNCIYYRPLHIGHQNKSCGFISPLVARLALQVEPPVQVQAATALATSHRLKNHESMTLHSYHLNRSDSKVRKFRAQHMFLTAHYQNEHKHRQPNPENPHKEMHQRPEKEIGQKWSSTPIHHAETPSKKLKHNLWSCFCWGMVLTMELKLNKSTNEIHLCIVSSLHVQPPSAMALLNIHEQGTTKRY